MPRVPGRRSSLDTSKRTECTFPLVSFLLSSRLQSLPSSAIFRLAMSPSPLCHLSFSSQQCKLNRRHVHIQTTPLPTFPFSSSSRLVMYHYAFFLPFPSSLHLIFFPFHLSFSSLLRFSELWVPGVDCGCNGLAPILIFWKLFLTSVLSFLLLASLVSRCIQTHSHPALT